MITTNVLECDILQSSRRKLDLSAILTLFSQSFLISFRLSLGKASGRSCRCEWKSCWRFKGTGRSFTSSRQSESRKRGSQLIVSQVYSHILKCTNFCLGNKQNEILDTKSRRWFYLFVVTDEFRE